MELLPSLIGGYGAVLSTFLLFRELYKGRRRIRIFLEYIHFYDQPQITITNIGLRPITITEIGFQIHWAQKRDGKIHETWESVPRNVLFRGVKNNPLPFTLKDGEHISLPLHSEIGDAMLKRDEKDDVRLWVYDVEGNVYDKFSLRHHNPKWGFYQVKKRK